MNRRGRYLLVLAAGFMALALTVVGFSIMPFSDDESLGAEGCCMMRGCPDDTCTWYVVPGGYENCKALNQEKDGDSVEDESGLVWWSESC
jgi:hypothetical protein